MFNELFEPRIAKDAIRIYNLTNFNRSWTQNEVLRDSIIGFRKLTRINYLIKDSMEYDHFWSFICNGGSYKSPDGTSQDMYEVRYDLHFLPTWNASKAPPKGNERTYRVDIFSTLSEGLSQDIPETEVRKAVSEPLKNKELSFEDQNNRDTINEGFFAGMEEMLSAGTVNVSFNKLKYTGKNHQEMRPELNSGNACYHGNEEKNNPVNIHFTPLLSVNEEHTANLFYLKVRLKGPEKDKFMIEDSIRKVVYKEDAEEYIVEQPFKMKVPDEVSMYDNFRISLLMGKEKKGNNMRKIAEVNDTLYVTLREAKGHGNPPADEGLVYFACSYAKNSTTKAEVFQNIWKKYEKRDLIAKDFGHKGTTPLTYYNKHKKQHPGYEPWVFNYNWIDGQCGFWQELFIKTLRMQGFGREDVDYVSIKTANEDEYFLVKNWHIPEVIDESYEFQGNSYDYLRFGANSDQIDKEFDLGLKRDTDNNGQYSFFSKNSLKVHEEAGIPGQNEENPYSDFSNHQFVIIKNQDIAGHTYYDPSYGKAYEGVSKADLQSLEEKIIDGYYRIKTNYPNNNVKEKNEKDLGKDLNGDGKIEDKKVPVWDVYFRKQNNDTTYINKTE